MHLNSRLLFEKYATHLFKSAMRVLEIGPDGFPSTYEQIVGNKTINWETLDMYASQKLTHSSSAEYDFPIPADTFDIVFSASVIEHVKKIWLWMKELARVCKPGGLVITINPVSWEYHEFPVDCWRIYPEGMRALYEEAGLEMGTSVCESLEPYQPYFVLKQALKRLLGRRQGVVAPVFDTISIGSKAAGLGK